MHNAAMQSAPMQTGGGFQNMSAPQPAAPQPHNPPSQTRVLAIPQPGNQMGVQSQSESPGNLTLDQALANNTKSANEGKVASALLGNPATTPATATFRRAQAPGSLPTEKMVLWILVAAMPTFVGLLLASDIAGSQVDELVRTIGGSVRDCSENFFQWIRNYL